MAAEILNLSVRGMTCANCVRAIERKLSATPGVTKVTVDLNTAHAAIEYDDELVKPEVLSNAVRDLGYDVAA
jgi:copper chaperone CopZ